MYPVGTRVIWDYIGPKRRGVVVEVIDRWHRRIKFEDTRTYAALFEVHIDSVCLRYESLLMQIAVAAAEEGECAS